MIDEESMYECGIKVCMDSENASMNRYDTYFCASTNTFVAESDEYFDTTFDELKIKTFNIAGNLSGKLAIPDFCNYVTSDKPHIFFFRKHGQILTWKIFYNYLTLLLFLNIERGKQKLEGTVEG